MTYHHRWRKAHAAPQPVGEADRTDAMPARDQFERIGELKLEHSRLRRLVADLLLEKMRLEEGLHDSEGQTDLE